MQLQSVFDYRSPYAYLANTQLSSLAHPINYLPVDILAVMKAVNNQPSPACPAKARYSGMDAARWAGIYQVPLKPNAAFFKVLRAGEFDGAWLSRAAVAALQTGVFDALHSGLFAAIWAGEDDLLSPAGRSALLSKLNIDVDVWQLADSTPIREQLLQNNEDAAARGVFGVPSFFCDDELFFGNDRLEFVRAALKKGA